MDAPLTKTSQRKKKKPKIGCCSKFLSCLCCCFIKKGKKLKWGIGSDIWNKLRLKFHKKQEQSQIYTILLDLYSHKPSVEELVTCKISPTSDGIRDDLEFYIPQLCNLLLYGYTDHVDDIIREVLNICSKSFFFSHRILWYIYSTDFESVDKPSIDPASLIDRIIETCSHYKFYHLGNGDKLFSLYEKLQIKHGSLGSQESQTSEFLNNVETIAAYNAGLYKSEEFDDVEAKFIPMNSFISHKSYFSTLKFVERLTIISENLLLQTNKTEYLIEELKKLNQFLPAEIYIPFNSYKSRQSAILHIPVSEARVFTTKERAPFKISIEIFRPYKEVKYESSHPAKAKVKSTRSNSLPIGRARSSSFGNEQSIESNTKSLESDASFTSILTDEESLASRKRNQTFAVASTEVDFSHYAKFIQHELGSISAVYGDVDEAGKSVSVFKESFKQQSKRIQKNSPYGKFKTWGLLHVIVKSGDDLRQEQFAMQLISFFKQTFVQAGIDIWLYPYDILATGIDCGILECVPDAVSIDGLKKSLPADRITLYDFFLLQFGDNKSKRFKMARQCFMRSLAGYSLVCYILQIKDRHNGNILIDRNGHLIHIDFGFMLSNSPGGNMNFEQAPFKLTDEFERVLGGRRSKTFQEFRHLCVKGYSALKEKSEQIILMVEMMRQGSGSNLGCFIRGDDAISTLRERLKPKQKMLEKDCKEYINELIDTSLDNWSTKCYDRFQYCCQNIFY